MSAADVSPSVRSSPCPLPPGRPARRRSERRVRERETAGVHRATPHVDRPHNDIGAHRPQPRPGRRVRRAQAAAADAGHQLTITSGFRTAEEQAAMFDAEVAKRGSLAEAQRWVFPPDKSMHVQGLAIDVGDGPAADWLADEGARFGLCHTLAWEWWHFEWRERWEETGACPAPAQVPDDAPPA